MSGQTDYDKSIEIESVDMFTGAEGEIEQGERVLDKSEIPEESEPPAPPPITSFMPGGKPPEIPSAPPVQEEGGMHVTALVFLDDPIARRLVVAWQTCGGNKSQWLEAAGLESKLWAEANRLCTALLMNKICRDGGVVDKVAMTYIAGYIKEQMAKRGR